MIQLKPESFVVCHWIILIISFITSAKSDSGCFLENGGSSLSFFVSEDAPIGYNLGTLQIQGDVSRDIVLRLRETTAPVRIEPGTKNITLTRKLDKEGVEGPSTVTFTVLCDKRHHTEPSIGIPVTIRVSDVNDNEPRFIDAPSSINVSEQTLPGSTILSGLKAIDMDQHGPYSTLTFSALDLNGKPSNMVSFAGGGFEGRLILTRPLDFESMPSFDVILRVSDHGTPPLYSDMNLKISVTDSDDLNPRFEYVSYSALLPTNPRAGMILQVEPGPIRAMDQDTGINARLKLSLPEGRPEAEYFRLDENTGRISLTQDVPDDQLNQPVTLVLKAEQLDNPDRYAISTLNVGKKGNHNAPLHFVQPEFQIGVPENSPLGTILFTALTSRPADRNLKFFLQGDKHNLFQVGTMGQLFLKNQLDYEQHQKHILKILVTDGFQNASTTVVLNVLNVNDWGPRFRQSLYEFNVSSDNMSRGKSVGQIEVADGDLGDRLSLEIKNTDLIRIDEHGKLYVKNRTLVKREMMFLVVARDSGDPPREAFVPVVVRLTSFANDGDYLYGEFDTTKIALVSSLALVALSLAVGMVIYFGYCRKRRKIQSENFQKRIFERNISNPLAIHKLVQPGSLRRSNKIRNMSMNITAPVLANPLQHGTSGLTPLDPASYGNGNGTIGRNKSVSWSPKLLHKNSKVNPVSPPSRLGNGSVLRVTSLSPSFEEGPNSAVNTNSNGFELDPDTSVTPLETFGRNPNSTTQKTNTDTLQSTSSLTLYF